MMRATLLLLLLAALPTGSLLHAQEDPAATAGKTAPSAQPSGPAPIRAEDYGQWERLGFAPAISPDGRWIAYTIRRVDETSELRVRMLATESTEVHEFGDRATFSGDNQWLAWSVGMHPDEREKQTKAGKTPQNKMGLKNLVTGKETEVEDVASFAFSDDGGFLAMRRYPAKGSKAGATLVVRDLATGRDTALGNVDSYAFQDDGPLLALVVHTEDKGGNGVQVYDAKARTLWTLDSAEALYQGLTWREDSADLAVLREMDHEEKEDASHVVLAWRNVRAQTPALVYDHRKDERFTEDLRVVTYAGLSWSDDGSKLFFGLKEWDKKPKDFGGAEDGAKKDKEKAAKKDGEKNEKDGEKNEKDGEKNEKDAGKDGKKDASDQDKGGKKSLKETLDEPAGVDIWHAKDIDIIPLQKKTASRDQRESMLAVLHLGDGRLVKLGDEGTETVRRMGGDRHALGLDNTPHEEQKRFGPTLNDVYVIDLQSGSKRKILEANKYLGPSSPNGRYVTYVKDGHHWCYDVHEDRHVNLTQGVDTHFMDQEASQLTDEKPPYGVAGWSKDGGLFLCYDRFDLWTLRPDGSRAARVTRGAEEEVTHRLLKLDPEEEDWDLGRPHYVRLYGERTKRSGFGRLEPGGRLERLLFEDRDVAGLAKAEEADVYVFTRQDFDDSPDLFVAGADLAEARQVSATNPFQKDFLWGHSELIDYVNEHGEALQGALYYPAGYEAGKQYPMITYIYELRSQVVHQYPVPTELHPYNPAVFTAEGYFVFQPDIVYRAQNPGLSALECVVPAVKKVLESGMVDPKRVGLIGHSWGGYQTAFLSTTTDIFAACIAGAPLTNMMSMSMSIYWNSGQTDAWIFHESQGRMDQPFWRDVDTYIKNSPIFNLDTMVTPLLMAFGDEDGAVDWHQGIEFYNAARLAQKQFVLLVYAGENHSNAKKPNQLDYHYRVLEWFGHYLKGDEAPAWITEGKPYLEREKELEELKEKKGPGK